MDDAGTLGRLEPADAEDRSFSPAGGLASDWTAGSGQAGDEAILDQAEVDRLLGYDPHEASGAAAGSVRGEVGSTLMFEARTSDLVTLRCGDWLLAQGRVGRMDDRIAVQVATPLSRPRTTLDAFHSSTPTAARRAESP